MVMIFSVRFSVLLGTLLLAGCSTLSSVAEGDKVDYKTSENKSLPKLEIPPDLTVPQGEQRYAVPNSNAATTASDYQKENNRTVSTNVLPSFPIGRIERDGARRWLVMNDTPEHLWPVLRQFWNESGFVLVIDKPDVGIMETEWAENKAKLPQDIIRRTLGSLIDSLYSTSERDKFRLRVERNPKGESEIYITHRGMQEQLVGSQKERTMWTARPADPELEAEFLSRLMVRLGTPADVAKKALAATTSKSPEKAVTSNITMRDGIPMLAISEPLDRAWRSLGIALDRTHFTVEDRDNSKGIYFVRYVSGQNDEKEKGLFAKLFSSEKKNQAKRYQVKLDKSESDSANSSVVTLLNEQGKAEASTVANDILKLLDAQLQNH
jgi:outer membrane protein assembly factor BamC